MNTEKPEPPEGYRLLTEEEKQQPLPMDAVFLTPFDAWLPSKQRGVIASNFDEDTIYATRTPIPSPEHNPDGLTPEQYGAPEWRLLREAERQLITDEVWMRDHLGEAPEWKPNESGHEMPVFHGYRWTIRRRVTPIRGEKGEQFQKGGDEPCPTLQSHLATRLIDSPGGSAPAEVRTLGEGSEGYFDYIRNHQLEAPPAAPDAQGEKDADLPVWDTARKIIAEKDAEIARTEQQILQLIEERDNAERGREEDPMKYNITKSDGSPVDPNAVYFVLRLDRADEEAALNRQLVTAWAERRMGYNPEGAKAAFAAVNKGAHLALARAVLAVAANMGKASPQENQP